MAELNVEPKKKSSSLVWIIVIIIIILLILFFVFRGNNNKNGNNAVNDNDTTTSMNATSKTDTSANTSNTSSNTLAATEGWQGIDYNAPKATYPELNNKNIEVRDNDKYAIYSLGQSILFDADKSSIRSGADKNLNDIATSIKKRYDNKKIRIYGFTDSTGSKNYNQQLSEQRAAAVESALVKDGIDSTNISLEPVGETRPVASNKTAEGRQENRRVEIVVSRT
jgi:outer membrane protein OmpA-like peptidoglycan-associated protein